MPPLGQIPAGFPQHLGIGLQEAAGATWARASGIPFNFRYRYLTKGWFNNWGYDSTPDGSWARGYMDSCPPGMIPTFAYYCMLGEAGFSEQREYATMRDNVGAMRTYYNEWRALMQRCKEYGKPVLIVVEADTIALVAAQCGRDGSAYAHVQAAGAGGGLANTVRGWIYSFPYIRNAVGASNVILALHVPTWLSGVDVLHGGGLGANLQTEVTKGMAFLGGTDNTYDLLFGDPCDRDAGFYASSQPDRTWDASRYARYAEWLRLWNQATSKRWVLWQIPHGTSQQVNATNSGQPGGGWKDNRVETWLGPDRAPRNVLVTSGVIGLLFGAGRSDQSTHLSTPIFGNLAHSYYQNPTSLAPTPVPQPTVRILAASVASGPVTTNGAVLLTLTVDVAGAPWTGSVVTNGVARPPWTTPIGVHTWAFNVYGGWKVGQNTIDIELRNVDGTLVAQHRVTFTTQLHVV